MIDCTEILTKVFRPTKSRISLPPTDQAYTEVYSFFLLRTVLIIIVICGFEKMYHDLTNQIFIIILYGECFNQVKIQIQSLMLASRIFQTSGPPTCAILLNCFMKKASRQMSILPRYLELSNA